MQTVHPVCMRCLLGVLMLCILSDDTGKVLLHGPIGGIPPPGIVY